MIKCLVTGGAGFIGSHLIDLLLKSGYDVYCLDNLITGSKKNINDFLTHPRFRFIYQDITQAFSSNYKSLLSTLDYIYHLASPASPNFYQKFSIETLLTNSYGTYQMLELSKKTKASFLLASTSEIYGNPLQHPQKENYFGNVNPIGVRACYDEAKRFAEALTMEYYRKFDQNIRIARIFNTYGPKMKTSDGRVIVNFINQALTGKPITVYGDGFQTRSFCYISDMVLGLKLIMEGKNTKGEVINLGYPKEYTINQIANLIKNLTNSRSKIIKLKKKEDDPVKRRPDIEKAKKILHWEPVVDLREGLIKTIKYYRKR